MTNLVTKSVSTHFGDKFVTKFGEFLTQHLVQLLSQFNRVPLSLCGKGFCVVWTKTNTPSPVMLRHGGHVIIGTVQGLGWTLLATRDV